MSDILPLFDYQAVAADVMSSRKRFGLHDEMGIGKTATTIGAINRVFGVRGVIICPAMLRENWVREIRRFSTYPLRVCKGQNIHDFVAWSRGRFDVLVTSYELATKWLHHFITHCEFLDFIAWDEGHFLKNPAAARTVAMFGEDANGEGCWAQYAEHAWHITGTPMANDPMDIFTFLRFTGAISFGREDFTRTFLDVERKTYGMRTFVKPEMVATLQQLIYNNAIRRTHADVGLQLPDIWMQEILVDGDTKEITDLVRQIPGLEQIVLEAIETGGLSNLSKMSIDHIATLRRLVGKAKAAPYSQMLVDELNAGCGKRVVFGVHVEPLYYIQKNCLKHGHDAVIVNGDTNEADRVTAVQRFMEDPKCKVFVGNIKVAGVGLTLTESSEIDMFESDWSPAGNAQAIKRVHRIGQTKKVRARFITLAKSIDESVNRIVAAKTASIAAVEGHAMTAAPLLTV